MARHEPAEASTATEHEPDGAGAHDRRFDAAKPAAPTHNGFSAAGLARSAMAIALLGAAIWAILAVLDQPAVGLVLALPVVAAAIGLYVLSVRRRLRDAVVQALADALAGHLQVPGAEYLEIDTRQWRGGWVGVPHLLNVRYPAAVDDSSADWAEQVATAVHAELGEQYVVARHNVRDRRLTLRDPTRSPGQLSPESGPVSSRRAAAARRLPDHVSRTAPSADDLAGQVIPLGVDSSGTRVAWDPLAPQGHLLALGRSGSGKRVLLTGLILEAAARGWPVWVIDHRRVDLLGVRDWPNVQIVASTLDDQIVVLNQAWREMEGRVALVESGADRSELEPMMVVIHHFREFATAAAEAAARAGQASAGAPTAADRVADLLRHGRRVNMIIVLSVQRSDDPLLRDEYADDLGAVVALGRMDAHSTPALRSSADDDEDGTEAVPGRAKLRLGDAPPVTLQCYWTPDPREARRSGDADDATLVEAFRPHVVTHPVLHVQRPRVWNDTPAAAWKSLMEADLAEGFSHGASGLVDWSRARSSGSAGASGSAGPSGTRGKDVEGWSEVVMVSQLEPGHLARLDDETGWVVVEQVEAVENDGTKVSIGWRGTDGAGSLVVSRTRTVRIRHMNDGVY